jgi:hypothetical protein
VKLLMPVPWGSKPTYIKQLNKSPLAVMQLLHLSDRTDIVVICKEDCYCHVERLTLDCQGE